MWSFLQSSCFCCSWLGCSWLGCSSSSGSWLGSCCSCRSRLSCGLHCAGRSRWRLNCWGSSCRLNIWRSRLNSCRGSGCSGCRGSSCWLSSGGSGGSGSNWSWDSWNWVASSGCGSSCSSCRLSGCWCSRLSSYRCSRLSWCSSSCRSLRAYWTSYWGGLHLNSSKRMRNNSSSWACRSSGATICICGFIWCGLSSRSSRSGRSVSGWWSRSTGCNGGTIWWWSCIFCSSENS